MLVVCEVVDGESLGWKPTSFNNIEEWKKAFNGQGTLVLEPSLATPHTCCFRLIDPPNKTRIFRVDVGVEKITSPECKECSSRLVREANGFVCLDCSSRDIPGITIW